MQPNLSKFQNKRILVVGDIMLDEFIYTTSTRTSPEYKDVPVLDIQEKFIYPGGAANVALNIRSMQAIPYLAGLVGNDAVGKQLCGLLGKENIPQEYLFTSAERNTTAKTRILKDGRPVFRLDDEEKRDASELENNFLLKNIRQCISDHKPHAILVQDYNKGVLNSQSIPQILSIAKENKIPICVDPKFKNWELYQNVDLFKPNLQELKVMSDELRVEGNGLQTIAKALQDKIHFKNLLITLGAEGNYIYNNSSSQISTLNFQLSTPDVCGAGDSVIAVTTLGLICGFSLPEIAELANKAGYIACQKKNVQPVNLEELLSTNC